MEDKFSPEEILDYLNSQITPETPISRKLSLYTQAIQNQLDNSETSLKIWLEYLKVIYENEQDVKTIQSMFKMLISSYGRYFRFWKTFIEFMRINGNEKKIIERYKDEIKTKSYQEKELILEYFDDVLNDRIGKEEEPMYVDKAVNVEIKSSIDQCDVLLQNDYSKAVQAIDSPLLTYKNEDVHVETSKYTNTWQNNVEEEDCRIKISGSHSSSIIEPFEVHCNPRTETDKENISNYGTGKFTYNQGYRVGYGGESPYATKMKLNDTKAFARTKHFPESLKTGILVTPKSHPQDISDNFEKLSLEIKKPEIGRSQGISNICMGVDTENVQLDFNFNATCFNDQPEARKPVSKAANSFYKTKLEVNTQDVMANNVLTFQSTINKKDSSSSLYNCEKIKRKEIALNNEIYEIVSIAGKGGFGIVFQVLKDLKIYALKKIDILGMEEHIIRAYENEIDILKRLKDNDEVIKLYDYQISDEHILILMEYGKVDLLQEFKRIRDKKQSIHYLKYLWEQLINCVKVIHENKIIHRDLKPANFLVVDGRIKLIDFGISKKIRGDTTNVFVDKTMGTVIYMAPEAIISTDSKINRKSDIWSLGCILYESLYGYPPFKSAGHGIKAMNCILDEKHQIEYPALDNKYNHMVGIIKKCLTRDVQKRCTINEIDMALCDSKISNTIPVPKLKLQKLIKTLLKHNPDKNINIDVQVDSIYKEFIKKI